ncbi:MAG: outer membrane protein assembly factor BamA [Nitrospinaceae bacterium]|nr:outer membrane protein assembly factor BamA [Nitrospinaceae bacterium]
MMMKFRQIFLLISLVILVFAFAPETHAQDGGLVGSVKIQGNKRVDDSTILYYIKTRKGEPLSRNQIRKDIEQIYNLGQFKDIRVETQDGLDGLEIVFIVEEIPSIGDVVLHGNDKLSDDEIREKLALKRGTTFQEYMIQEAKEAIKLLYHEKGFFFVETSIGTKKSADNLTNINIRIREGEKVRIKNIRFVGNKRLVADDLKEQMETKAETWFSFLDDSGIYKKDILKLDMFRLEGFYHDNGYIRVRVLEPKIDINKKDKAINIIVPIKEGPQYRVRKISAQSDETLTEEEILKAIKIKVKDVYNVSGVRADILNITELYSQRGYAYADVNPVTKINDDSRTVDLSVAIDKGRKVYVGEISLLGNTRTLDNVIRREFRLKEGEVFDSEKLKRSKQRINNLQFFEDVKIDTRRGRDSDLIDIVTTVTERPTGSVSVGAGFSSVENLIFTAGISQDNFLGRGQKVVFSTSLSSIKRDFNLSLTDPRIFDTEILAGIDAFNRKSDFFSFSSRNTGGGLRFGKAITEYDWVGLNYRFEDVEIADVDPDQETSFLKNEKRLTSRISPTFIRDTRDNFLNPSTGWRHVVRFDLAGGVFGGTNFHKMSYETSYYRPLIGKLVGMLHGQIAWADGYGDGKLPSFERYFLGGPSSLRGYTIRDVGPRDAAGDPIGGNQSLLINAELQYPFTKGFRGFVFYDRGNVYGGGPDIRTTTTTWDLVKMRDSIGAGVRFLSPFGPVGFAYGLKLDQTDGENPGEFHFSAGSAF